MEATLFSIISKANKISNKRSDNNVSACVQWVCLVDVLQILICCFPVFVCFLSLFAVQIFKVSTFCQKCVIKKNKLKKKKKKKKGDALSTPLLVIWPCGELSLHTLNQPVLPGWQTSIDYMAIIPNIKMSNIKDTTKSVNSNKRARGSLRH